MSLKALQSNEKRQLLFGLGLGICFGFLLQKGGATKYDIIINQLLLKDFTVVKIMLSAVATGALGIHLLRSLGYIQLHPKPGSLGSSALGSLIFGIGFALLGYCPGTVAGAVGNGSLDALFGGVVGIFIGIAIFAAFYPKLNQYVLTKGNVGELTIPQFLKVNPWFVVIPVVIGIIVLLVIIENAGL